MTGIILAGGEGSRLGPLTTICSKQLLSIYDKPMIFYSVSTLILSGVNDIIIVTKTRDLKFYTKLFGDGSKIGIDIRYVIQDKSLGIPHAINLCSNYINEKKFLVCLGDNIFHGSGIIACLNAFLRKKDMGAKIFVKYVYNPESFGVAKISANGNIKQLVEKPNTKISNYAVTGIYGFDVDFFEKVKTLKPSIRGELEIIDLLKIYLDQSQLDYYILGRGVSWLDTGTCSSLNKASNFVESIQSMSGSLFGSPEEASYRMKFINKKKFRNLCKDYGSSEYANNLKKIYED